MVGVGAAEAVQHNMVVAAKDLTVAPGPAACSMLEPEAELQLQLWHGLPLSLSACGALAIIAFIAAAVASLCPELDPAHKKSQGLDLAQGEFDTTALEIQCSQTETMVLVQRGSSTGLLFI